MTDERWHRRHALQIAAQLPDGLDDALAVLEHARVLLTYTLETKEQAVVSLKRLPLRPVKD